MINNVNIVYMFTMSPKKCLLGTATIVVDSKDALGCQRPRERVTAVRRRQRRKSLKGRYREKSCRQRNNAEQWGGTMERGSQLAAISIQTPGLN